jgi:hypothetical protein
MGNRPDHSECVFDAARNRSRFYFAYAGGASGPIPVFRQIAIRNTRVEGGGRVTLEGYDATHRLGIQFDNVVFDDRTEMKISAKNAAVRVGPGPFDLTKDPRF